MTVSNPVTNIAFIFKNSVYIEGRESFAHRLRAKPNSYQTSAFLFIIFICYDFRQPLKILFSKNTQYNVKNGKQAYMQYNSYIGSIIHICIYMNIYHIHTYRYIYERERENYIFKLIQQWLSLANVIMSSFLFMFLCLPNFLQ